MGGCVYMRREGEEKQESKGVVGCVYMRRSV